MREIKFRAWNEFEEHFVDSDEYAVTFNGIIFKANLDSDTYNNLISNKNLKLMQYTGLKDKNGVEIYEGDIVKIRDTNFIVVYQAPSFVMKEKKSSKTWVTFILAPSELQLEEVIGNIYENKDLV